MTTPDVPASLVARRRSESRLFRGYGPLFGWITVFLAMVLLAPTVAPERVTTTKTNTISNGGPPVAGEGGQAVAGTAGTEGSVGATGVASCPGPQIPGDPYSPPCRTWDAGDNGGVTARGVTKDTINVLWRDTGGPYDIGATIGALTGKRINTGNATREDVIRTYETLIEYMNRRFQFYGRKMKLVVYRAGGSSTDELLGGGQAGANADAIKEAQQLNGFADLGMQAPVFADALARQGVIATNPIYPSLGAYERNSPFNFGLFPDCDKVAVFLADFLFKEVLDYPVLAGEFKGQKRKVGIVYPESPAYSPCVDHFRAIFKAAGRPFPEARSYRLALDSIPPDARDITAAFANDGITTPVLFTDPLFPYFATATATQSNYHPEWIQAGVAFMDTDFAAQLYDPDQWKNAFGVSLLGDQLPARSTYGYAAYRSIDSTTSPVDVSVEAIYYNIYMLALGIQMAGPNLTPQSLIQGLHAYKSAQPVGPAGAWSFPNGQFTAPSDGRVVWWDPTAVSSYNGQRGAYQSDGRRFAFGQIPSGQAQVKLVP